MLMDDRVATENVNKKKINKICIYNMFTVSHYVTFNGYDRLRKKNNLCLFAISFFKHLQQVINCMR